MKLTLSTPLKKNRNLALTAAGTVICWLVVMLGGPWLWMILVTTVVTGLLHRSATQAVVGGTFIGGVSLGLLIGLQLTTTPLYALYSTLIESFIGLESIGFLLVVLVIVIGGLSGGVGGYLGYSSVLLVSSVIKPQEQV